MEQDQNVQKFLNLLLENGREGQAKDLSALLSYMDGMERQYNAVCQELQEVKQQLVEISEHQSPVKKLLTGIMDKLETRLNALHDRMNALRDTITSVARDAVENFKSAGVTALDKAVAALHFKPALETIQTGLQKCVSDANTAIRRAENVSWELGIANRHIRNALYAAVGKAPKSRLGGSGRVETAVLAPIRGIRNMLSRMNNNTLGAISAVERLEQAAVQRREARTEARHSIRAEMEDLKKESAAHTTDPERKRKPKEVEL